MSETAKTRLSKLEEKRRKKMIYILVRGCRVSAILGSDIKPFFADTPEEAEQQAQRIIDESGAEKSVLVVLNRKEESILSC